MRKLRVLVFIFCGVISILETFAQSFEIKAGVNLSTMLSKDDRSTYSSEFTLTPRLLIGVTTEIPITKIFSFETGLLYSSKGYKLDKYVPLYNVSEPTPSSQKIYEKATLNYIEIPLSIKTSRSLLGFPIYELLGPYVAIGINGKTVTDLYPNGISERKEYKSQIGQDGSWKRFDYGLQAGAGVTFGKYVIGLNYSYGLANISQHSPHVEKNRIIGLTLGYKF